MSDARVKASVEGQALLAAGGGARVAANCTTTCTTAQVQGWEADTVTRRAAVAGMRHVTARDGETRRRSASTLFNATIVDSNSQSQYIFVHDD